ncbi:MAG: hypothetical protein CUN53_14775 [Phototrophicales bacterium]|nr:MAG: hypothetical protein CUN53_14775 [Phototrophicales bacterium]
MKIEEIIDEVRALPAHERAALIKQLLELEGEAASPRRRRSILEFEGVGAEMWANVDVQTYIDALRDEWDHRS